MALKSTAYERTLAKWTPKKETALQRALATGTFKETELALNKRSPDRATRLAANTRLAARSTFNGSELELANRSPNREKRLAARSTQFNDS